MALRPAQRLRGHHEVCGVKGRSADDRKISAREGERSLRAHGERKGRIQGSSYHWIVMLPDHPQIAMGDFMHPPTAVQSQYWYSLEGRNFVADALLEATTARNSQTFAHIAGVCTQDVLGSHQPSITNRRLCKSVRKNTNWTEWTESRVWSGWRDQDNCMMMKWMDHLHLARLKWIVYPGGRGSTPSK